MDWIFFVAMRTREAGCGCSLKPLGFPHAATRTNMQNLVKESFGRKDLPGGAKKKTPTLTKALL
jgi:hypothetical protein